MSISGIVLITVCFANALTIQAHYCPCTYNNKFLISEKPSFLGVDNSYIPALNYYPNLHQSAFQQDLLNPFPQQFHKKIENTKISEITKSADQAKEEKTKIKDQSVANVKMQIGNMKTEQPKKNSIAAPKVAVGVMDGMKENKQIRTYAVEEKRNEGSKIMEQKVKSGSPIATPLLIPKSSEESANVLVTKNTHQATHQQMFQLFSPVFMEVKKPPQKQESTETTDSEKHEEHHDAHHHDHDKNIHYKFEYSVNDEKTKDIKSQREERQGDVVRGEYSLRESDGNVRTVKYYADWKTGFHADVQNSKRRSLR